MDIKVMLWYDVEDYITPEADDALGGLIDMMDKRGIVSSLKVVGDKARVLVKRGRFDILKKMSGHEICYHTDNHSRHPVVSEYLESYGFADGAEEFERQEQKGFRDVSDITGQALTSYGQAGGAWAPQVFPVLRKWGVPTYLDDHDIIKVNGGPFWYGGVLNFTSLTGTMRMEYPDIEKAKQLFDTHCENLTGEKTALISIFYHPCEFSGTKFWDGINFSHGKNTPAYDRQPSPLRDPEDTKSRIEKLGEFIDYTLTKDNVEYITAQQSTMYELRGNKGTKPSDVESFASTVGAEVNYADLGGRWYAASELMSAMERYLSGKHITPVLSYGPERSIPSCVNGQVKVREIVKAFNEQYGLALGYRQLPDTYRIGEDLINPVDLFCTMAKAIKSKSRIDDSIDIVKGMLVPAQHVNGKEDWGSKWSIFAPEFKVPNIINMAKLQCWTLKPARY